MSAQDILYHMLGIRGYRVVKNPAVVGGIEFYIEANSSEFRCPDCGSFNVWRKGSYQRQLRLYQKDSFNVRQRA
ncbi:MAG: hypothetical protein LBJ67_07200 [Planctomycetaceae bacterium]|jgi:predicted RNA-binding Zn-ribbon protein involved in translation (DUF1610 family)|nr:hypothetical protein [Planctomycetaceae bacterium]